MFKGKKVLVCGLARSGMSAAYLLKKHGAVVTGTDTREIIDFKGEMPLRLGQTPDTFVHEFDLVIISPGISVYAPFVQKAQNLGIPVWGEAELAYALCPCPMIAITGTNGKTTVSTLVGEILKLYNGGTVVAGNIGVPLTGLVDGLCEENLVVAEISSFQLETIENFRPKISAVLNMTPDHLDRHGSMEVYIAMKEKIFKNQRQNDKVVLNYDNSVTKKMKPACDVVYFSKEAELKSGVFVRGNSIYATSDLVAESELPIAKLSDYKMMTENALAAVAISLLAGVSVGHIREGLKSFKGIEHRLELVSTIDGVEYYNDSKATNVDAAVKALQSFNHKVVLIAGGSDKGANFAPWVRLFKEKVSYLVLIGETAGNISKECTLAGFANFEVADSLETAVEIAKQNASKTVLFSPACASFDMFKDFEDRGRQFKEIVERGC